MTYSGSLGDWYTGLFAQTLVSKKHFSSFLFYVVFQQKYVEKTTNDFKILLIQNGLECKNPDRGEKQWDYKVVGAKEETVNESVFIQLTT